jgi:hypothetical protein
MTQRNLFTELTEGFDALAAARKGKKTLRTKEVELKQTLHSKHDYLHHQNHQTEAIVQKKISQR